MVIRFVSAIVAMAPILAVCDLWAQSHHTVFAFVGNESSRTLEILATDVVRSELGLSTSQVKELMPLADRLATSLQNATRRFYRLPVDQRKEGGDADRERTVEMKHLERVIAAEIRRILDDKQAGRLEQILNQFYGAGVFDLPEVVADLKVTKVQAEEIARTRRTGSDRIWNIASKHGAEGANAVSDKTYLREQEMESALESVRRDIFNETLRVLTPIQRNQLDSLLGPPINLKKLQVELVINRHRRTDGQ